MDNDDAMLNEAWALNPDVALRSESFGALAYHFGNRRLTFLKRPALVALVRALGDSADVRSALATTGVAPAQYPAYLRALRRLADADMIRPEPAS